MNLEPETRKGYYISAEMKKVWAVELEMLNKLLDVCNKYNLKIWAEGGTLLGAVREQGYIPWDDDIDMAMPREDYDKLQSIAFKEFKAPFYFQTGYTDLFPNGMAKLRKDGTAAIEKKHVFKNQHQGIFIDIFPLDIVPEEKKELTTFTNTISKIREELYLYCDHNLSLLNWKYNFKVLRTVFKIKFKGFHNSFEDFERYVKKYETSNFSKVSLASWGHQERYLRSIKWYKDTCFIPFEDLMIPVPSGYHYILSKQYGDYMTPLNTPSVHGGFEYLSSDISYKSILPTLRRKLKEERWNARKAILHKILKFKYFHVL